MLRNLPDYSLLMLQLFSSSYCIMQLLQHIVKFCVAKAEDSVRISEKAYNEDQSISHLFHIFIFIFINFSKSLRKERRSIGWGTQEASLYSVLPRLQYMQTIIKTNMQDDNMQLTNYRHIVIFGMWLLARAWLKLW